jgi:DNA-binding NtrC family response regulator
VKKSRTVLIVDEEASFRCLLAAALRDRGIEAFEARDAFEAFQKVSNLCNENLPPDLLIIAIQMKVVNGAALLDRLAERGHAFPVVFTSYFMDEALFAGLMRKQCVDFIEKPAPPEEVAARIADTLHKGEEDRLPSRAVFRRKGGDAMIIEWSRPGPKGQERGRIGVPEGGKGRYG